MKHFFNFLIVHFNSEVYTVREKLENFCFSFVEIFALRRILFNGPLDFHSNIGIELRKRSRVVLFIIHFDILIFLFTEILNAISDPGKIVHPNGHRCFSNRGILPDSIRHIAAFGSLHFAHVRLLIVFKGNPLVDDQTTLIDSFLESLGGHVLAQFQETHLIDHKLRAAFEDLGIRVTKIIQQPFSHGVFAGQKGETAHLRLIATSVKLAQDLIHLLFVLLTHTSQMLAVETWECKIFHDDGSSIIHCAELQVLHVNLLNEEGNNCCHYFDGVRFIEIVFSH